MVRPGIWPTGLHVTAWITVAPLAASLAFTPSMMRRAFWTAR